MLIGNKVDKSQRVVSREIGESLARDFQISFLGTSANEGTVRSDSSLFASYFQHIEGTSRVP